MPAQLRLVRNSKVNQLKINKKGFRFGIKNFDKQRLEVKFNHSCGSRWAEVGNCSWIAKHRMWRSMLRAEIAPPIVCSELYPHLRGFRNRAQLSAAPSKEFHPSEGWKGHYCAPTTGAGPVVLIVLRLSIEAVQRIPFGVRQDSAVCVKCNTGFQYFNRRRAEASSVVSRGARDQGGCWTLKLLQIHGV